MPHSSRKPPLFVRFLSVSTRSSIAIRLREWSAELAEWIAPELHEMQRRESEDDHYAAIEAARIDREQPKDVLDRLVVLHHKLEHDGLYVRANTVWLAIEEIKRLRELEVEEDGQPDEQREWRDYDPDC